MSSVEDHESCEKDVDHAFFNTPWIAILKTSVMFMGEIEFSDIPMDENNVGVILGYIYVMAFILMVVLVLMNLLNALAVSDISEVMNDSEIEFMLSNIGDISSAADKTMNPIGIIIYFVTLAISMALCAIISACCCACCCPCITCAMYCFGSDIFELASDFKDEMVIIKPARVTLHEIDALSGTYVIT